MLFNLVVTNIASTYYIIMLLKYNIPSFASLFAPQAFAEWLVGILPGCGSVPESHKAASAEHPSVCVQEFPADGRRTVCALIDCLV